MILPTVGRAVASCSTRFLWGFRSMCRLTCLAIFVGSCFFSTSCVEPDFALPTDTRWQQYIKNKTPPSRELELADHRVATTMTSLFGRFPSLESFGASKVTLVNFVTSFFGIYRIRVSWLVLASPEIPGMRIDSCTLLRATYLPTERPRFLAPCSALSSGGTSTVGPRSLTRRCI